MDEVFYTKTEAGKREIRTRECRLPPALRTLLLVIDGQRSGEQLQTVILGLRAPADALDQLRGLGLIEPVSGGGGGTETAPLSEAANRYGLLYALMTDAVREHMGVRGYFFQLKIERAEDADGLLALLPDLRAALVKARGEAFAVQWEENLRAVAGI